MVLVGAQWLGTVTEPLGDVGDAQWGDWLELLAPWAVTGAAVLVLVAAPASRRVRVAAGAGLVAYVHGHGIHLAANSIATRDGGDTAYLWDELVSHQLWLGGAWLLLAALVTATREALTRPGALHVVAAAAVGATLAANGIGGHAVPLTVAAAAGVGLLSLRRAAVDGLVLAAATLVTLVGYAVAVGPLGVDISHT